MSLIKSGFLDITEYKKLWSGFCQTPEGLKSVLLGFFRAGDLLFPYWSQMISLLHLLCACVVYITTQSWVRLLEWVLCVSVWAQVCKQARALVCVCVQPSLKAFKQEWERVWDPGMTSLSMMSFLQGDFGTCDRLGEVTLSLLTHCNWQWNSRSPLQIESCQM